MMMIIVMMCLKLEQIAYDEDLSPRLRVMPVIHILFEEINQLFFQIMGSQKTLHIKGDGSEGDLVRTIILIMTWTKSVADVSITNEIIAQIKDKGNNSKPPPDRQSGSLLRQTTWLQACMWTRQ